STQIGGELSVLNPQNGMQCAVGLSEGSNNRIDNNSSQDPYLRIGYERDAWRTGLFFYYSPDILGADGTDQIYRFGPDLTWFARRGRVTAQFLAGYDSNPTNQQDSLWFYGGFLEGSYRWDPALITLLRVDSAGMPTFDDRSSGGTSHVQRTFWELTGSV